MQVPHHHNKLPLLYGKMDQSGNFSRLSADIPAKDKNLIKSVCPKQGILNQLTQNLFHAITTNLRINGITYYSPEHEDYFIALILRGCTAIESAVPTSCQHVNGRITLSCAGVAGGIQQLNHPSQDDHNGEGSGETDKNSGCEKAAE
jgi:hypothetical protein